METRTKMKKTPGTTEQNRKKPSHDNDSKTKSVRPEEMINPLVLKISKPAFFDNHTEIHIFEDLEKANEEYFEMCEEVGLPWYMYKILP